MTTETDQSQAPAGDPAAQNPIPRDEKARLWAELDGQDGGTPAPALEAAAEPQGQQQPATPQDAAPAASEPGGAPQEADPYAGLPPVVRDEIAGLKSMLGQATQRLRNAEGHIGGLNSQLRQMQQAAQATRADGGNAPSAAQVAAAQGDRQAMAKLVEDYPEFGAAMKAALDAELADLRARVAQPQPAQQPAAAVTPEQLRETESKLIVEARHQGWQDTVKTPAFQGWLQRQPDEYQMLAASNQPAHAIRLLDLYKEASTTPQRQQQQHQQRLAAAAAIPDRGSSAAPRAKPIEQMSRAEYWAYLDQLDKEQARAA